MKAFLLDKPGEPETLRLADVAMPEPAANEVRVKVAATALNPVDYKIAERGAESYPHILGLDVAGTIDAVGSGVSGWKKGDRVYYHGNLRKAGGYAEYALSDADALAKIPESVSFAHAAGLVTAGFTAYQAIHLRAPLKKGQTVLIHGGSGGVGGFAIQLAKRLGLNIIATASPKNFDYVRSLGAHHVVDYKGDVGAEVKKITNGRGVDLALDSVGSESATKSFRMLAFSGHLVVTPQLPDLSIWKPFDKAVAVHEIALGAAHFSGDQVAVKALGETAATMIGLLERKEIDPLIGEIIDFKDIPAALGRLKRREVPTGKVVAVL